MYRIINVSLKGRTGLYQLTIDRDKIYKIEPWDGSDGEIDGGGMLLTESFVVPHVHIDKVETGPLVEKATMNVYQMGTGARDAIKAAAEVKKGYDEDKIYARVKQRMLEALKYGVTYVRGFVDVDTAAGLKGFAGAIRVRDEIKEFMQLQVVAFPQQGLLLDPGAIELVEEAVKKGADVVGGIPWIEENEHDQLKHINQVLDIARKYSKPAAFLVDDAPNPALKTLEMLADETLEMGMQGKVEACHARALQLYNESNLNKVLNKVKLAGISLVTNPHTGAYHLPVEKALAHGINVSLGQDDCNDAYYPYGRCNMLEVGFLATHLLWSMDEAGRERIFDMITVRAAKSIGIENHKVKEGSRSDLVVLNEPNLREAFRYHREPRLVLYGGRPVATGT
ncbi:MAG: amidohydrolase family protein [Conexivisphaerales archaeon]